MRIVDLSLPINSRMAGIPGIAAYDDNPTRCVPLSVLSERQAAALAAKGIEVGQPPVATHMMCRVEITTHIGTHIDAPSHMLEDTWSIDEFPLERLVRKGKVVPLTHLPDGACVTAEAILATGVDIDESVIPVLYTGWTDRTWGSPAFWGNSMWLHKDAGDLLAARNVSAVALDFFPEFPYWRTELTRPEGQPSGHNHRTLFRQQATLIQMVTNVGAIGSDDFTLCAVPLKLEGIDGSPARVFAMIG